MSPDRARRCSGDRLALAEQPHRPGLWSQDAGQAFDYHSGANVLSLAPHKRVKLDAGPRAGDVYEYLGPTVTVTSDYTSAQSPATVKPRPVPFSLP